jgi:hypothetical protein
MLQDLNHLGAFLFKIATSFSILVLLAMSLFMPGATILGRITIGKNSVIGGTTPAAVSATTVSASGAASFLTGTAPTAAASTPVGVKFSSTANQWWEGKQMLFYPAVPGGYKLKLAPPGVSDSR